MQKEATTHAVQEANEMHYLKITKATIKWQILEKPYFIKR